VCWHGRQSTARGGKRWGWRREVRVAMRCPHQNVENFWCTKYIWV